MKSKLIKPPLKVSQNEDDMWGGEREFHNIRNINKSAKPTMLKPVHSRIKSKLKMLEEELEHSLKYSKGSFILLFYSY